MHCLNWKFKGWDMVSLASFDICHIGVLKGLVHMLEVLTQENGGVSNLQLIVSGLCIVWLACSYWLWMNV